MMRKIITVLLAFLLLLLIPVSTGIAADEIDGRWSFDPDCFFTGSGLTCKILKKPSGTKNGTVAVVLLQTEKKAFSVPSEVKYKNKKYTVTQFGWDPAESILGLEGELVTAVDELSPLRSITLPKTVKKIGRDAFRKSEVENVYIKSIKLSISEDAFRDSAIKSIVLPKGTSYIGVSAFRGCSALKSVYIPSTVTKIGGGAFNQCGSLKSISIDGRNKKYRWKTGALMNKKADTLISVPRVSKTYTVPKGIKHIGDYALSRIQIGTQGDMKNQYIKVQTPIESIGARAFYGSGLRKITLTSKLKKLGKYAFAGTRLTEVAIPKSIKEIPEGAFMDCGLLKSVTLKKGLTKIGSYVFARSKIETVSLPSTVKSIGVNSFAAPIKSIKLNNGLEKIGGGAFSGSRLKEANIPASVTSIGDGVFWRNDYLEKITVAAGNKSYKVVDNALYSISGKTLKCSVNTSETFVVPEGVTTVETGVFNRRIGRNYPTKHIVFPKSLKRLGLFSSYDAGNFSPVVTDYSLMTVTFQTAKPPEMIFELWWYSDDSSENLTPHCTYIVPAGSRDAYLKAFGLSEHQYLWQYCPIIEATP